MFIDFELFFFILNWFQSMFNSFRSFWIYFHPKPTQTQPKTIPNPTPNHSNSNPKTLQSQFHEPNPKPISHMIGHWSKPNLHPKTSFRAVIPGWHQPGNQISGLRDPIPILYPKTQSQIYIPKPNPKPISQIPIPNLYPKTQSQTYIPNPIPILECFSGRLRFPVLRFPVFWFWGKVKQHDRVPRAFLRVAPV